MRGDSSSFSDMIRNRTERSRSLPYRIGAALQTVSATMSRKRPRAASVAGSAGFYGVRILKVMFLLTICLKNDADSFSLTHFGSPSHRLSQASSQRDAVKSTDLATDDSDEHVKKKKRKGVAKRLRKGKKIEYPENHIVSRIVRAAAEAKKAAAYNIALSGKPFSESTTESYEKPPLIQLTDLTASLNEQLLGQSTNSFRPTSRLAARDSMTAVISYNFQQHAVNEHQSTVFAMTNRQFDTKEVAILFVPPLVEGKISIDGSCRIKRLVRALEEEDYMPKVIFVIGEKNHAAEPKRPSYCALLRQVCKVRGMNMDRIRIRCIEYDYEKQDESIPLNHVAKLVQHKCIPRWRYPRLRIHMSIISADYHICQLHDLQMRSPLQSPLRVLHASEWERPSAQDNPKHVLDTQWSYVYATTGPALATNNVQGFLQRCYRISQELRPVVVNLRGIVNIHEFFQKENYFVLVSARRSLVTEMESIYQVQPSLKEVQHILATDGKDRPLDLVLESALLSLGRCLDLVRPAGLLTGSVPADDWKLALSLLDDAVSQIALKCNPDRPLDAKRTSEMFHGVLSSSYK